MTRDRIDFAGLAEALLRQADSLVARWLPNGHERHGRWYVGDFDGSPGESANVNLRTGQWIDNAGGGDDCGGDLISLYARIHNMSNGEAARELMRDMGWERPTDTPAPRPAPAAAEASPPAVGRQAPAPVGPAAPKQREQRWRAVVPVPEFAPQPDFVFGYKDEKRGTWVKLTAVRTWAYRRDGRLYGYVARFERVSSEGEIVKDTVARTWCQNLEDGSGAMKWHWKQWEAPRPLYLPQETLHTDGRLVVVVEGEKCAAAGAELLPEFDWVSWPGGCKAWAHSDWSWLAGRSVVLWPDCDAERERLTKAEREAGVEKSGKPILPAARQPGMAAMVNIGTLLMADHGCEARLCAIPAPGAVAAGWDVADAIAQGWTADQVRAVIDKALPLNPSSPEAAAKAAVQTPSIAAAEEAGEAVTWWRSLLLSSKGAILPVRENVVLALDGMQLANGRWLPGAEECQGLLAYNEFTNNVIKTRAAPWGTPAGVWEEHDELEMGVWLSRELWLPPMGRSTLEEAVSIVARRHRHHPAREHFAGLRGTWDGQQRLRVWLPRVAREEGLLQEGEDDSDRLERLHNAAEHDELGQYLARVGTWVMMAIVARVMDPGVKFDYMLILEGGQGMGKSTLCRTLGMEWFADTGLVLGDKDSYQNLQGILVYEWGELDSLTRAEVTKVKQFVSSQKDRFRASFDRRPKDYPRQVVFIGTTNESHYLSDPTGNRRFWPLKVTRQIDLKWLRANLDQLYAEALTLLEQGKRFHPTLSEQRELFDPQQLERTVENALESAIRRYLYDEDQRVSPSGINGSLINEITLADLLSALGVSVDKQTPVLTKQASAALGRMGWERGRASSKGSTVRPWVYRRPARARQEADNGPAVRQRIPDGVSQPHVDAEATDGCPF